VTKCEERPVKNRWRSNFLCRKEDHEHFFFVRGMKLFSEIYLINVDQFNFYSPLYKDIKEEEPSDWMTPL